MFHSRKLWKTGFAATFKMLFLRDYYYNLIIFIIIIVTINVIVIIPIIIIIIIIKDFFNVNTLMLIT